MFALSDECEESYAVVPVALLILQGLSSILVLPTDFQDAVVFCFDNVLIGFVFSFSIFPVSHQVL